MGDDSQEPRPPATVTLRWCPECRGRLADLDHIIWFTITPHRVGRISEGDLTLAGCRGVVRSYSYDLRDA